MKIPVLGVVYVMLFWCRSVTYAQTTDRSLMKKITINGVCLCNATLDDIKQANAGLTEVAVEEMDLTKSCIGQGSRFVPGTGYATDKFPGMIFQKDQTTSQISKIRLTKTFKGNLPNGKYVDMSKLLLKDLFTLYPQLKDTWGSRGCTDYWNFSNDTISFFVKIDKSKKPQFPVDESFYENKPIEAADLVLSCYSLNKDKPVINFDSEVNDPVFFLDSIRVNKRVLANYEPDEIADITVFKDTSAIKRIGPAGKNGLVYIETKDYARQRYLSFFRSKSAEFARLVPETVKNDSFIQYILNSKLLTLNYEYNLSLINNSTFKSLTVLDKNQLLIDFNVTEKQYGVRIVTEPTVIK